MNRVLSNKKAIAIFVLPAFVLFTVFVIAPIFMSFYYSLINWTFGAKDVQFVGLKNYIDLFKNDDGQFLYAITNSLKYTAAAVFVQLPIAFLLAAVLATGIKGEGFFRTAYFIPVVVSGVVIGQLWLKIYNYDYGMLNTFLKAVGLSANIKDWLGDASTATNAIIVTSTWQYIPYHMLLLYAGIKSVPKEVLESAKIDGASFFKTLTHIIIPMMMPMIEMCVTFSVIGSLKIFDMVYAMTPNGGPLHSTDVPSTMLIQSIFTQYQYSYGSAMACFIVIECLVLTIFIQRIFRKNYES